MSRLESLVCGDVPVLLRYPVMPGHAPLIVLWHGFGPPGSERKLAEVLPLDDVAAVKAYLGLPLFGARMPRGGPAELVQRQAEDYLLRLFLPVTEGAAHELPRVVDEIATHTPLDLDAGVGLFGFSAGGAAALRALTDHVFPVRAAVVYNAPVSADMAVSGVERATGTSYVWSAEVRAVASQADALARAAAIADAGPASGDAGHVPPALLLLHAEADEYFTAAPAEALHQALRREYEQRGAEDRLALQVLPGLTHHFGAPEPALSVPIADPAAVRITVAAWFRRWL